MDKICRNCEHYIRHFVFLGSSFSPINHGHCTYPRLKNREADCKACKYFEERKKDDTASTQSYIPGVYSSSVKLNDTAIDVQVTVDENNINSVALINLNDTVETMYPLVKPAMEDLQNQILEKQSTSNIDYSENSQYTSKVLLSAIDDALSKAKLSY